MTQIKSQVQFERFQKEFEQMKIENSNMKKLIKNYQYNIKILNEELEELRTKERFR